MGVIPRITANAAICLLLLILQAFLAAHSLSQHSLTVDEGGHVLSGVLAWEEGRVDVYPVNPPLVKALAALPVVASRPELSDAVRWTVSPSWDSQNERFAQDNSDRYLEMIFRARYVLVGLSVLGGWLVYRWSSELFGQTCGLVGLALWAFCPNVLCWAGVCTVDLGASVMGLAAAYAFHYYLHHPSWLAAAQAGWVLGLAMLSKFTLLVFYPVFGLVWLVSWWGGRKAASRTSTINRLVQVAFLLLVSVLVIDMGYGFQGVGRSLDSFSFRSRRFNEFLAGSWSHGSWLERVPVPLPEQYVKGLDQQIANAEVGPPAYLDGAWKKGGWWYFYLYALAVKLPLGTLGLMALALVLILASVCYRVGLLRECEIWLPAMAVMVLLSWQMRDRYASIRYVLPALPFLFVGVSRVGLLVSDGWATIRARSWRFNRAGVFCGAIVVLAGLLWNGIAVARIHPHYLSYFNELAGGPDNGWKHLLESNIDWGQDLLFLKHWVEKHPETRPLGLAYYGGMDPHLVGLEYRLPCYGPEQAEGNAKELTHRGIDTPRSPIDTARWAGDGVGPQPGWYAVSVNFVCGASFGSYDEEGKAITFPPGVFRYFRHFDPEAKAGYSIFIYHITRDEANRVRSELGLPLLPGAGNDKGERGH